MNIREAIELFEKAEADALVVVEDPQSRQVIGTLTEQHALRRYAEELERSRRSLAGTKACRPDPPMRSCPLASRRSRFNMRSHQMPASGAPTGDLP